MIIKYTGRFILCSILIIILPLMWLEDKFTKNNVPFKKWYCDFIKDIWNGKT